MISKGTAIAVRLSGLFLLASQLGAAFNALKSWFFGSPPCPIKILTSDTRVQGAYGSHERPILVQFYSDAFDSENLRLLSAFISLSMVEGTGG